MKRKFKTFKTMQPQYFAIEYLPGLALSEQKLLQAAGIKDTQTLLQHTKTLESKLALASKLSLNLQQLNKWAALADLSRIPSVGHQYCGLLLHSGIVSVLQLKQSQFHRLHTQILRLQVATLRRKDLAPPVEQVRKWIEEAKTLQSRP